MKKQIFLGALAVASLSFTACSDDNTIDEIQNPSGNNDQEQIEVSKSFQSLGSFDFETKLGEKDGASASSRTLGDVNDEYRPHTHYYLDHVFMLALNPEQASQPKDDSIVNEWVEVKYDRDSSTVEEHDVGAGECHFYNLYYKLGDNVTQENDDCSLSGSVWIGQRNDGGDAQEFKLSVFLLEDLYHSKENHIPLNKFAFNKGIKGNLRGTTLRYTSFNPYILTEPAAETGNEEGLSGQYVSLPKFSFKSEDPENTYGNYNFFKDTKLDVVTETQDRYFSGSEFLIAADKKSIYLLQVVPRANKKGGYFEVRKYPSPAGQARPEMLALNRLTTCINASFIITDDTGHTADYFVKGDLKKSIQNFKDKTNIDLSTMTCPHATIDGINTHFYINDPKKDNTACEGRLVLWAAGCPVKCIDGKSYDKQPTLSNDVFYEPHTGEREEVIVRGLGMSGNSYSVAFKGQQEDTGDAEISFFINVENLKIRIRAYLPSAGYAMQKNVAENIIVYIPETTLVNFIKENKARTGSRAANEYVDFVLPEGSVKVQ